MPLWEALVIVLAGLAAGTINTIVGSGTLITFPTLLLLGFPPIQANITNSLGLCASGLTAPLAYREEVRRMAPLVRRLLPMSVVGAVVGALLLLWLPPGAFEAIVPVLIALALVLVVFGKRLNAWAMRHHVDDPDVGPLGVAGPHAAALAGGVLFGGVYGGYFGAAQGILLMGLFSILLSKPLHDLNALKNVLVPTSNFVAAVVFVLTAGSEVRWSVAALLALGALAGGWVGGHLGKRLPPAALRGVIVAVGLVALVKLLWPA